MNAEIEMARVWCEAQGENVWVNGWQEGIGDIPGFAMVTDKVTCTTFSVKPGESLADALGKAQAQMASGQVAEHESAGI